MNRTNEDWEKKKQLSAKNVQEICNFVKYSNEKTIKKFTNFIISTNNARYIYKFAKDIKGANVKKLQNAIITINKAKYIYLFARDIREADVKKLQSVIIETKNAKYIYLFARGIWNADVKKLQDAIIETKNAKYICKFAEMRLNGINVEKLQNAVIKTNNIKYIYEFACNVKGAKIEPLQDAIIKTKNAKYIYNFACNVKGANIRKLEEAILKTGEITFIIKFMKNILRINHEDCFSYLVKKSDSYGNVILMCNQFYQAKRFDNLENYLQLLPLDELLKIKENMSIEKIGTNYAHALDLHEMLIGDSKLNDNTFITTNPWIVNLSLTEPNVLVGIVANHPEVVNNKKLYLELLEKFDNVKYSYYKDAFNGIITFEQADEYYKYDYQRIARKKVKLLYETENMKKRTEQ